jgi:hypothetical protein
MLLQCREVRAWAPQAPKNSRSRALKPVGCYLTPASVAARRTNDGSPLPARSGDPFSFPGTAECAA